MRGSKVLIVLLVMAPAFFISCGTGKESQGTARVEQEYPDGIYRGSFIDSGEVQVSLQFKLQNNVVTEIKYSHLAYKGNNCLEAPWGRQYQQAIQYLVGKDIRVHLNDLYKPGDFVDNVDTYSGATIRAVKVRSAIKDALNREAYSK